MRLAVTGTTGFLGRHLTEAAVRRGHAVRALVRAGRPIPHGAEPVAGELSDRAALHRLVAGAEVVLHLAALGVQSRDRDWERMVSVNVKQPLALAEEAARAGARSLVAAGTVLEYRGHGRLPDAPAPLPALCAEDSSTDAGDPYGATKAAGGLVLRARARDLGLPCWYLRLASMYGPGDDEQKFLPAAVAAARGRRPFDMTPGEQVREWLHVDDAVEALLAAADAPAPAPETGATVNVGTGEGLALRDVVRRAFERCGADPALVRPGARPYRTGEVHRLVMTTERARAMLPGWSARVGLDEGLAALAGPSLHRDLER
jgi:nucleoside-diphosphate-sugar epimerase